MQRRRLALILAVISVPLVLLCADPGFGAAGTRESYSVPSSWEILPILRYVDYSLADDFVALGKVAVVRKTAAPYQTVGDTKEELVGESTVIGEELRGILMAAGVTVVESLSDDLPSYAKYDTLPRRFPTSRNHWGPCWAACSMSADCSRHPRSSKLQGKIK